jgi:hypothetical protein
VPPRAQACVYDSYTPTLAFSSGRIPEIVAHIRRAQAAGQPGAPGGRVLTRAGYREQVHNRRQACTDSLVRR